MVRETGVQYHVVIPKAQKMSLDVSLLTLSIIIRSRENGASQGKEERSPLHFGIVAIKNGTFGSHSTTVGQFTYLST